MKQLSRIAVVILTMSITIPVQAQLNLTFKEIFKQKKTEIQYLSRQIAELQLYIGAVKKGYTIVQSGLGTIHNIKNGEFTVHDLFYTSQYLVSTAVRSMPAAKKLWRTVAGYTATLQLSYVRCTKAATSPTIKGLLFPKPANR
ncbi:hypothetical protein WJU16_02830 [Chitinophaga pollutisoli]|uniref:Uncharacterized protein n=1 Tax=Chitinophaga pollutisoli TaxID=3133966 RepID=A0ABZ2YR82_9BACT